MKHLKTYEENSEQSDIEIGDYVIARETFIPERPLEAELKDFTSQNIGKYIKYDETELCPYIVKYDNVPEKLKRNLYFIKNGNRRRFAKEEIYRWSKNPKDLEIYVNQDLYNV